MLEWKAHQTKKISLHICHPLLPPLCHLCSCKCHFNWNLSDAVSLSLVCSNLGAIGAKPWISMRAFLQLAALNSVKYGLCLSNNPPQSPLQILEETSATHTHTHTHTHTYTHTHTHTHVRTHTHTHTHIHSFGLFYCAMCEVGVGYTRRTVGLNISL